MIDVTKPDEKGRVHLRAHESDPTKRPIPPPPPPPSPSSSFWDPVMTMRDQFAATAMQGMLANLADRGDHIPYQDFAKYAYKYADAMMKARKGGGE